MTPVRTNRKLSDETVFDPRTAYKGGRVKNAASKFSFDKRTRSLFTIQGKDICRPHLTYVTRSFVSS
jgi:hypothetical protein